MERRLPVNIIASCLAMTAFSIAVISGLFAGNPSDEVLLRAVLSLAGCFVVGVLVGKAAEGAILEHVQSLQSAPPAESGRPAASPQSGAPAPAASGANPKS